jgi:hypothetical protein
MRKTVTQNQRLFEYGTEYCSSFWCFSVKKFKIKTVSILSVTVANFLCWPDMLVPTIPLSQTLSRFLGGHWHLILYFETFLEGPGASFLNIFSSRSWVSSFTHYFLCPVNLYFEHFSPLSYLHHCPRGHRQRIRILLFRSHDILLQQFIHHLFIQTVSALLLRRSGK